jgi:signal transduction histidine kinase
VFAATEEALTLAVSDNGAGLPPTRRGSGMGLQIMAHRAELIGGEMTLESAIGGGTCVRCRLALAGSPA